MKSASKKKNARHSPYPLRRRCDPYRYSPIDKGASEIRLMTLLPGPFGAKIRLIIRNTRLTEFRIPNYEALSYTWGSPTDLDYIYVQEDNGEKALAITPNLAEALRYLRYEDRSRVLWIDAICVDQKNTAERGHQVLRMADIYRQAGRVIVWLGPERDDSTLAMQVLDALGSTIQVDWALLRAKPLSDGSTDRWSEESLPFVEDRRTLAAIGSLLDRSWFKRLWIWQEVRLANLRGLMICGRECMLWDIFRNALFCLHSKKGKKKARSLKTNYLMKLCDYKKSLPRLRELLHHTAYAQCSDERDRIYAILNVTHDFFGFEPDYSKTTRDVFKSVVLAYTSKKDLAVLSQCEMRENREMCVPTWVPDWTTPKQCDTIDRAKACSETEAQARCDKENVLVVSGCLVDTLEVIDQIPRLTSECSTGEMHKIVRSIMGRKAESSTCAARDSIIDSACRTLCCNYFDEGYLPLALDLPNTQRSRGYVRDEMDNREPEGYDDYINLVRRTVKGRASFQTRNGRFGIGPQSIRAGDQACVILGCDSLLILRPNDSRTYKVVGECYIDGFVEGEALLGSLPTDYQRIERYFADLGVYFDAFMNVQTRGVQVDDPRLGSLPAGWRIADHREKHAYNKFSNEELGVTATNTDPRLTPEALRARGVKLQEIRLV